MTVTTVFAMTQMLCGALSATFLYNQAFNPVNLSASRSFAISNPKYFQNTIKEDIYELGCAPNAAIDSPVSKQETASLNKINDNDLRKLRTKYDLIQRLVEKKTASLIRQMQKREEALYKKMSERDSMAARRSLQECRSQYEQFQAVAVNPQVTLSASYKEYLPGLDSIQTALKYLGRNGANSAFANPKLQQIQVLTSQLQSLQGTFRHAGEVQDYVRQREQQLKDQLKSYGLGKQLTSNPLTRSA